jgi:hypothetical protein
MAAPSSSLTNRIVRACNLDIKNSIVGL